MNKNAAVVWPLLMGSVMFYGSLGMIGWAMVSIRLSNARFQHAPAPTRHSVETQGSEQITSTEWHCQEVNLPAYTRAPRGIPAFRLPDHAPAVRVSDRESA